MNGLAQPLPNRDGLVISGHTTLALSDGWEMTRSVPGGLDHSLVGAGETIPAKVPGTVGSALVAAGADPDTVGDLDADDWWFRQQFPWQPAEFGNHTILRLDGLATVAEAWLNGRKILASDNMFHRHAVPLNALLKESNELVLGFRALGPLLVDRRPRPRWRTRIVTHQSLRRHRTTIFGRAAGFAPGPAPVGPWRLVAVEHRKTVAVDRALIRPSVEGTDGVLRVMLCLLPLADWRPASAEVTVTGPTGRAVGKLAVRPEGAAVIVEGAVTVPDVCRWWPHTHGDPTLYGVSVTVAAAGQEVVLDAGDVGFRSIEAAPREGLALRLNDTPIFCRGGALMPERLDLDRTEGALRALLGRIRDAGMNMIRLSGVGTYGDELVYRLCDELGLLVWQDFPFANMDYPTEDDAFLQSVEAEAAGFLAPTGRHASLAVLCGGSEVEQQATMMGVAAAPGPDPLFDVLLPAALEAADVRVPYLRSTPTGGTLPIRSNAGVAHYYGVGAYRRPLEDARRADVRFAAECLAFSNIPSSEAIAELRADGASVPHSPGWKRGVPRDGGAPWDFEDVRDHYLREIYSVDPVGLRTDDPACYIGLSQVVSGQVMADTLGEWRRSRSPCAGALLWCLNDVLPGAGWGIIDSRGRPKPAYWLARRPLAAVAVWTTDEGTNGLAVHVANDGCKELDLVLDVRLLRDGEQVVALGERNLRVAPHSVSEHDVESILGSFLDAGYAYRFGPPQHDVVAVTLLSAGRVLAQTAHFPLGRRQPEPVRRLGLSGAAVADGGGGYAVELSSRRVVEGVRVSAAGLVAEDDWLLLVPGFPRIVRLRPEGPEPAATWPGGRLELLDGGGSVAVELSQ